MQRLHERDNDFTSEARSYWDRVTELGEDERGHGGHCHVREAARVHNLGILGIMKPHFHTVIGIAWIAIDRYR